MWREQPLWQESEFKDVETAIIQKLKDISTVDNMGATTTKPGTTIEKMLNAIGASRSNLASCDDEQDG